jgi:hypothetical protein
MYNNVTTLALAELKQRQAQMNRQTTRHKKKYLYWKFVQLPKHQGKENKTMGGLNDPIITLRPQKSDHEVSEIKYFEN